jgi:isopropylmalate/homocitrate/citramalate synthase
MLKNPLTYEIITPKTVGVPDSTLVLGKHSGRHALGQHYEKLGHQFDRRELDEIYRRFLALADRIKNVEDHHLLELIEKTAKPEMAAAAAAGSDSKFQKPFPMPPASDLGTALPRNSMAEHHADQEDYLWGV